MLPCHNNNGFSRILFCFSLLSYNECFDIFLGQGFSNSDFGDNVGVLDNNSFYFATNFRICIRVSIGEVNPIIRYFPINFEGQLIVKSSRILSRNRPFLITNILTDPKPLSSTLLMLKG